MNAALLAAMTAFFIALIVGPGIIRYLHRLRYGQNVRGDGPKSHLKKQGTPTMGGVIIVAAFFIASIAFSSQREYLLYALFATGGYALIGALDDLMSILAKRSLGLKARHKLIAQILIALVPALYVLAESTPTLLIPFGGEWTVHPVLFLLLSVLIIVGFGNATNITDGLDGLLAGSTAISATVYAVIVAALGYPELSIFAAAVAGACIGFAWFNSHPAQVFMGDTGSLALGAAIGSIAVLTQTHLLALIIGGLFVIETASVVIQVVYFRLTKGRRIFRMSPIHHHFELSGWAETQVVTRFWLIAIVCGLIGLMAY